MAWYFVNAMTWENETHRVRRLGSYWVAERKCCEGERAYKVGETFDTREEAEDACNVDAYSKASGR